MPWFRAGVRGILYPVRFQVIRRSLNRSVPRAASGLVRGIVCVGTEFASNWIDAVGVSFRRSPSARRVHHEFDVLAEQWILVFAAAWKVLDMQSPRVRALEWWAELRE